MHVRMQGEIAVVSPRGSLVGGDETDRVEDVIRGLLGDGNRRMIVDLAEVVMMNSLAVGTLMGCRQSYRNRDGLIVLSGLNRRLTRIFLITQLTLVFDLYASVDEALAALGQVA